MNTLTNNIIRISILDGRGRVAREEAVREIGREHGEKGVSRKALLFINVTCLKRPMDLIFRFLVDFKGGFSLSFGL